MFDPCRENTNYKMSAVQNVMLRVTIILGMVVAVMAVLYFTPLPEHHFQSCDRPCHDLDWPMICRVKLEIEVQENIKYCEDCTLNFTNGLNAITVNRQVPGPAIQVCQNDILVVDVVNKIPGHGLSIHWRGQLNNEAPFMDGVPFITQCPIPGYTTFQYKFRASAPGTHLYHAYSDEDRSRGLFGALIVRQPDKIEHQRKYYDSDLKNHIILISEMPDKTLLINGKGPSQTGSALSIFNVEQNKRYRFRVAYSGSKLNCSVTLRIDNHLIKIIALDGNSITPHEAGSLVLSKGERVDFVLKTNQDLNGYFLRVNSCSGDGLALINYEGGRKGQVYSGDELKEEERSFDTALCESRIGKVCLGAVKSLHKIPEQLKKQTQKVIYLPFGPRIVNVNDEYTSRVFGINNLTFSFPSSPLLTQSAQVNLSSICHVANVPEECGGKSVCECVHVEFIPLGATTEIILINQDSSEEHIFHLHGYRFYVVGSRQFNNVPVVEEMKLLDDRNALFKRNFNNPVQKDTIRVAKSSVVALRFLANNPGFWMLRDEKSNGWTRGMDVIFQVGESADMVSAPSDFPKCGNYIGPDFFLM